MIETSKYYWNKDVHTEIANEINALATSKDVQVSRWVNNSKGRQVVTYKIHTGERNEFGSKQENVIFEISEDSGRGNKIYNEVAMLQAVRAELNKIIVDKNTESVSAVTYINIDERYGDAVVVSIADYLELNSDGNFEEDYRYGKFVILEDGEVVAEAQNV